MHAIQPVVDSLVNPRLLSLDFQTGRIQPMIATLGEVITEALERLGKSQMWLAEQVGVSPQAVTKWIQTGQISRENAQAAAPVLGLSLDALLAGASIEGAQIGEAIGELPEGNQQEVLDFIRYKFERSEGLIAGDRAAHYVAMIDRIKADMAARRTPPPPPSAPPPGKRGKRRH